MFSIRKLLSNFAACLTSSREKHYWIIAQSIPWQRLPCRNGTKK